MPSPMRHRTQNLSFPLPCDLHGYSCLDKRDLSTLSTVPTAATVRPVVRCTNTHTSSSIITSTTSKAVQPHGESKGVQGVRPESSSWHEWILLLAGSRTQIGGLAGHVIRGPLASVVFIMRIWQFSSSSPRAAVSQRKQCLAGGPVACRVAVYCPCLLPNGEAVLRMLYVDGVRSEEPAETSCTQSPGSGYCAGSDEQPLTFLSMHVGLYMVTISPTRSFHATSVRE